MKKFSLFLVALTIAMVSCEPNIENPTTVAPTVVTTSVTDITESTAKVVGQVTADGGAKVTERGICWNINGMPTVLDYCIKDSEVGLGTFKSNLSNLEANTTYYVRAYATNKVGTSYGEEKSFTTREMMNPDNPDDPETPDNPDNPETPDNPDDPETPNDKWVDLGLSVKWATCNVGASSPEEYGNYYAWGEIDNNSGKCLANGLSMSELKSRGYIDSEGNLTSSYDAATANLGGGWRMPTETEMDELIERGIWTWQYQNGVSGYKVTGPSGNSIFLPAAGEYDSSGYRDGVGRYGNYWSSTPIEYETLWGITKEAYGITFYSDDYFISGSVRNYRRSIRPVLE